MMRTNPMCAAGIVLAGALAAATAPAYGEEAKVLWSRHGCEMVLVEKASGEFGVLLQLSEGRMKPGDRLEGDLESINAMRQMKNLDSGEEIMMRGVRYSTSRKYVLQVMPKWCKAPKE